MKKLLKSIMLITIITLIFPLANFAVIKKLPDVTIDKLPANVDEFIALRDKIASTPQGGAAIMIVALIIYSKDEATGEQCLTIAIDNSRLTEGNTYKGYSLINGDLQLIKDQLSKKPYIPNSYILGTDPKNSYKLPDKLKMSFSVNDNSGNMEEGELKVFVKSSGADSDRPVKVKVNNKGLWKAIEWSSIIVGVKTPVKDDNL